MEKKQITPDWMESRIPVFFTFYLFSWIAFGFLLGVSIARYFLASQKSAIIPFVFALTNVPGMLLTISVIKKLQKAYQNTNKSKKEHEKPFPIFYPEPTKNL